MSTPPPKFVKRKPMTIDSAATGPRLNLGRPGSNHICILSKKKNKIDFIMLIHYAGLQNWCVTQPQKSNCCHSTRPALSIIICESSCPIVRYRPPHRLYATGWFTFHAKVPTTLSILNNHLNRRTVGYKQTILICYYFNFLYTFTRQKLLLCITRVS